MLLVEVWGLKTKVQKLALGNFIWMLVAFETRLMSLTAQIIANEYDLVAITETWLHGGRDWELNIQGYQIIRKDRQEGKDKVV